MKFQAKIFTFEGAMAKKHSRYSFPFFGRSSLKNQNFDLKLHRYTTYGATNDLAPVMVVIAQQAKSPGSEKYGDSRRL